MTILNSKIIAVVITVSIIAILLISGPANAFSLSLSSNKDKVNIAEEITFSASIDIGVGERLPVEFLTLVISGNENINCRFLVDGTPVYGCGKLTIVRVLDTALGKGDLVGNHLGTDYNWGYGYGKENGKLEYSIKLNTATMQDGIYSTELRARIKEDTISQKAGNILLLNPIIITNLAPSPSCVYEKKNITLSANIVGSIKEVTVEVKNDGIKPTTKNGDVYSSVVNVNAGDFSWRFVVKNIADELIYGEWQNTYVVKRTSLSINPALPDGFNNWYVTEPVFSLGNSDAINIWYRWDGTGAKAYSAPFNLVDIPNPPPETGGILELTYWSDTSCGLEQEQTKIISVDLKTPVLKDYIPADKAIISNKNPQISVRISEVYGGNSGINKNSIGMKLDDASVERTIQIISSKEVRAVYNAVNLADGLHIVEIFGQDNSGRQFSGVWSFTVNSSSALNLNVLAPENKDYSDRRIQFNISTNNIATMRYYEDGKWKTLCRKCNSFTRKVSFADGLHNLIIEASDSYGNSEQKNLDFFIDSISPRIIKTEPRRGEVVDGSMFYVKYTEENLKSVVLFYGDESKILSCDSGKNKECIASVDLSKYDGQYIDYWFVVSDSFESVSSRGTRIIVDSSLPVIDVHSPENKDYSRRVPFDIEVSEKVDLEYYDNSVLRPRWTGLCSNCDNYDRMRSFSLGYHNLLIRATDKAGNSVEESMPFTVV